MILPSKHFSNDRALITVGAAILQDLEEPRSISELWEKRRLKRTDQLTTFDWFILAVTFLFTIRAVEINNDGLLSAIKKIDREQNDHFNN